jgi:hypothetical protein
MATMAGGLIAMTGVAGAAVTDVTGSAYGAYGNISLFGGLYNPQGPGVPTVTLPSGGSSTAVTATAATKSVVFGPAVFFRSGTVNLSTQGTPGSGSVTSSTSFAATAGTSTTPCRARTVNDGVTASNTTVTSATAAFTTDDVGAFLDGGRYRTVTDGVTTASSTTVTSATAVFSTGDVGADIEGGSIPAGATITVFNSATSVTISATATATATSVHLVVQDNTYGGIPANATIMAVNSATSVTISAAATASKTGVHLAITSAGTCIYDSQFIADTASTTCTANDTGPPTASTSFTNGVLVTATDNNQAPTATTAIANSPAANLTINGFFKLGASDTESFTYIFNEQIVNADGSLTVNAAHLKPTGQTAYGDVIFGQSTCGVRRSTTTTVTSANNPSTHSSITPVTFTATVAPAAGTGTPTGKVQFTDNGSNSGTPVALSSGAVTHGIIFGAPGSHIINAIYLGSGRLTAADGVTTSSSTTVTSATAAFTAADVGATISGRRDRNTADGVTTSSSTTVTSSTAAFTSADVGANIAGGSIPAGATITAVGSATSVTISAAATSSATAVNLAISSGIPAGATISAFTNSTTVTISTAATSSATGLPLSIAVPWGYSTSTGTVTQVVN